MKKVLLWALSLVSLSAIAQQLPIDGTWKIKPDTNVTSMKPQKMNLKNGVFDCETCIPPLKGIRADGKPHPVNGDGFDAVSITIVDDHTLRQVFTKADKQIVDATLIASSDGKKLDFVYKTTVPSGETATNRGTFARVEDGEPGTHKISGAWKQQTLNMDESFLYAVYKSMPDGSLYYDDKLGSSYTAKFDENDYPMKGDQSVRTVSLKRIDEHTFEEWYKDASGKVVLVSRVDIKADGKHADMTNENKLTGAVYHFEAEKQQD